MDEWTDKQVMPTVFFCLQNRQGWPWMGDITWNCRKKWLFPLSLGHHLGMGSAVTCPRPCRFGIRTVMSSKQCGDSDFHRIDSMISCKQLRRCPDHRLQRRHLMLFLVSNIFWMFCTHDPNWISFRGWKHVETIVESANQLPLQWDHCGTVCWDHQRNLPELEHQRSRSLDDRGHLKMFLDFCAEDWTSYNIIKYPHLSFELQSD